VVTYVALNTTSISAWCGLGQHTVSAHDCRRVRNSQWPGHSPTHHQSVCIGAFWRAGRARRAYRRATNRVRIRNHDSAPADTAPKSVITPLTGYGPRAGDFLETLTCHSRKQNLFQYSQWHPASLADTIPRGFRPTATTSRNEGICKLLGENVPGLSRVHPMEWAQSFHRQALRGWIRRPTCAV
jgi:hypothetical protein